MLVSRAVILAQYALWMAGLSQLNEFYCIAVPYNVAQWVGARRMKYYNVFELNFYFLIILLQK